MSTARSACFVVTGEFMTETARSLMLEDDPGRAFRLLADTLVGNGAAEAAIRILKGQSDLTGDSSCGLELVAAKKDRELTRFKKDLRYIYAGRFKHPVRGWIRPVAMMTALGPADAEWASSQTIVPTGGPISHLREWHRLRAQFYTKLGGEAEALNVPDEGSRWVLFEPCGERPHWDRPPMSAQDALDEALAAGRTLERRAPDRSPVDWDSLHESDAVCNVEPIRESIEDAEQREREEDEAREAKWTAQLEQIGQDVRSRAGDDTFVLSLEDGRELTIPRAPFIRWALSRTEWFDTAPAWENVAPSGMKMPLDNPDHTDWVLGAGLSLKEAYEDAVSGPTWQAAFELQSTARDARDLKEAKPKRKFEGIFAAIEQLRGARHDAAVIVDAGECTGVVGVDIAVLPDAQADKVEAIATCNGVIVEKGGPLAHLIIVSRGRDITVMRHPDACDLFRPGMTVSLVPSSGRIVTIAEAEVEP